MQPVDRHQLAQPYPTSCIKRISVTALISSGFRASHLSASCAEKNDHNVPQVCDWKPETYWILRQFENLPSINGRLPTEAIEDVATIKRKGLAKTQNVYNTTPRITGRTYPVSRVKTIYQWTLARKRKGSLAIGRSWCCEDLRISSNYRICCNSEITR